MQIFPKLSPEGRIETTLSSSMRAYQVFQQAYEAKEIMPIAWILSDDFEFHNLSPVQPLRDSEFARKQTNATVCTDHLLVQNKKQYLQGEQTFWDKVDFFGITTVEHIPRGRLRVIHFRRLTIYEFETPSADSSLNAVEPEIGTIRRIKVMSDSAQFLRDCVILDADMSVKANASICTED
ncbi:hypothetical protein BDP27DRAFT_1357431 [Rhodocollybia butyracea]|uniref:Uncharacterized protein n=1 Tax=Rhodocollybia butyracea TaxID=206335 RepID=A0A9P5UEJ5_9AGAR|nr:hypothetical protein BDP27DRAFT_1357431 [Rhodocollybia butyracea]